MPLNKWIKPAAVFIASVALVWLAGRLPAMLAAGGAPVSAAPAAGDIVMGLLFAWPIYIALAICQALTFNYVRKFTTPIYLTAVFALALIMAWRYSRIMG